MLRTGRSTNRHKVEDDKIVTVLCVTSFTPLHTTAVAAIHLWAVSSCMKLHGIMCACEKCSLQGLAFGDLHSAYGARVG